MKIKMRRNKIKKQQQQQEEGDKKAKWIETMGPQTWICMCIKLKSQSKSHIEAPRDSWRNEWTSLVCARARKQEEGKKTKWWRNERSQTWASERASVQMLHRTCLIQLANHTIGNEWVRANWNASMSKRVFIFIFYSISSFFRSSCYCWLRIILLILLLLLLVLPIVDFFECVVFRSFCTLLSSSMPSSHFFDVFLCFIPTLKSFSA